MKTLTLKTFAAASGLVAITTLAVLPAYADTPKVEYLGESSFESAKSRDQVQQEYFQAMKEGTVAKATAIPTDIETPFAATSVPSNLLRVDVYAETVEWLRTKGADIGMGE
jgi:NAD(P)-dependent dehydrogenase (short-subunit alcohol dehydrogenase family)